MQEKTRKKILYSLVVGLLIMAIMLPFRGSFHLTELATPNQVQAKTKKTSWQKKLEEKGIQISLWRGYLPKITQKEYKKVVKKYQQWIESLKRSLPTNGTYPVHQNVTATIFWVGEGASSENGYISNEPSAWDELWVQHFGGVDDPNRRSGFFPSNFTPRENPFYVALPYNDFNEDGARKAPSTLTASWLDDKVWAGNESACKNRWVKIMKDTKTVYAQWQDVGPYNENDEPYVFGNASPANNENAHAGIDVSPAVRDYLGLSDIDTVQWQFVEADQIPEGPWKQIVTTSLVTWL